MDVVVAVVAEDRMIPGSTECYHNGSAGRFIFYAEIKIGPFFSCVC